MAHPSPNVAPPTMCRRAMGSVRTCTGSPVSSALWGLRVSSFTPTKPTATAAPIIRKT